MKKFQFRLEPVLKLRKYKERMAQMELAKAQAALQECRTMLEKSKIQEESARRDWDSGLQKGMWETEFRMYADHIRGLELQTKRTVENELRLQDVVEQRREDLMKVTVGRKSMDLLRDERFNQYLLETGRMEQKETDELANLHRSSQERLE
ncbi:MAG: flagellar export protein FliJ [Desulfatibacillum sp.]|nr:flagellar export protein FliJ [Desulfatibacillum sp.]